MSTTIQLILLIPLVLTAAQPPLPPNPNDQGIFKPSIAAVIGIFSIMFSLTFLLLMYGKFCRPNAVNFTISSNRSINNNTRLSGINKELIESLPFFKFSALKGLRDGLECSICLNKFENYEFLRLLPRCKHVFHINCIDKWLESHSSCPLCRNRVEAEDINLFKKSSDLRDLSGEIVEDCGESGVELYVEREQRIKESGGFKFGDLHNLKHRVVLSEVVFRSRWSDFNSADLISLDCEMMRAMSSKRVELSEICLGEKSALISKGNRCMSDITFGRNYVNLGNCGDKEEKLRKIWIPIARRTVKWFAGKEGRGIRVNGGGMGENV